MLRPHIIGDHVEREFGRWHGFEVTSRFEANGGIERECVPKSLQSFKELCMKIFSLKLAIDVPARPAFVEVREINVVVLLNFFFFAVFRDGKGVGWFGFNNGETFHIVLVDDLLLLWRKCQM